MRFPLVIMLTLCLAACASGKREIAAETVARTVDPVFLQSEAAAMLDSGYRMGAADKLKLVVFQVPDLSLEEAVVDAAGDIQIPLVGSVPAAGLTPEEFAREVEQRLGARYLRDPRVAVTIMESAGQKITIDGAVTKPGVYEMRGTTTLMQAVAMAEGATRTADLESVAVFRTAPDGRMVAVFNLADIRNGQAPDPVLRGDDIIVVDTSRLNAALREVVSALPGLAVFGYF
ncbi:polysaccharide biosynthesis/export family protein [Brevundimonas sp.]|uniref:polysaccharide biosynthesis/export family protein n=1 Tax=Brevundimonas sp. TaxID=1871086 RepID=UPI003918C14C